MVIAIVSLWVVGIVGSTLFISGRRKDASSELMETIITHNNYPPIGDVMEWGGQEKIYVNHTGMLQ